MEPSPDLVEAIEFWRSTFNAIGTGILFGAGWVAVCLGASFIYVLVGLLVLRIWTGRWMSPQAEAFLGVPPLYRAGAFEAKVVPEVNQAKAKPKWVKKRPLPAQEPPRPANGPRVQRLDGERSFVPWRVHLDECASSYKRKKLLAAHGFDVTMTHEVGLLKASDRMQLNFAIRNRAVIVTFDRDFLDFHNAGERHSGIIHSPQDPRYDQEILRILLRMSKGCR